MDYAKQICEAAAIVTKGLIDELTFDRTIKATIVDNLGASNGQYVCKYENLEFTAYGTPNLYNIDDCVFVSIPLGDWKNQKNIISKLFTSSNINAEQNIIYNWENEYALEHIFPKNERPYVIINNEGEITEVSPIGVTLPPMPCNALKIEVELDTSALNKVSIARGEYGIKFNGNFVKGNALKIWSNPLIFNSSNLPSGKYGSDLPIESEKIFDIDKDKMNQGGTFYFYPTLYSNKDFRTYNGNIIRFVDNNTKVYLNKLKFTFGQKVDGSLPVQIYNSNNSEHSIYYDKDYETNNKQIIVNTIIDVKDKDIVLYEGIRDKFEEIKTFKIENNGDIFNYIPNIDKYEFEAEYQIKISIDGIFSNEITFKKGSPLKITSTGGGVGQATPEGGEIFNSYEGYYTNKASNSYAHAEGYGTKATGSYTHAEGHCTESSRVGSHAEGHETKATGWYSHAEGGGTIASDSAAHAEGGITQASGMYSHAEGYNTKAIGGNSHAEGYNSEALVNNAHAEGYNTKAGYIDEGERDSDHAEHAEGYGTQATGKCAHAEGYETKATGWVSHAEGWYTTASGHYSHAGGFSSISSAYNTFAHGAYSKATANHAVAIGRNTSATEWDQVALGCFNVEKGSDTLFILGDGKNENTKHNAFEIIKSEDGIYSLKIGNTTISETQLQALLDLLG